MKKWSYIILTIVGLVVFLFLAQIASQYSQELQSFSEYSGWMGVGMYILLMFLSVVFAPLNTVFLIPLSSQTFGPFWAAIYSLIGWITGSMVAFWLARELGQKNLENTKIIKKLDKWEKKMPLFQYYIFIIFLRMFMPADILSYSLGLMKRLGYKEFFWTTVLGLTPFAFIFTYVSTSSLRYQIVLGLIFLVIYLGVGIWFKKNGK